MMRTLVRANVVAEQRIRKGIAALQAEKENLEQSASRYRSLFANSLDAVLSAHTDGRVQAANPAACRLFGYTEAEMQQLGHDALVDRTDPRLPLLLGKRAAFGRAQGHIRMLKADGSSFEAEVAIVDLHRQRRSCGVRRDRARRHAQPALGRAPGAAVGDSPHTPDFVGITDASGRNLYLNRSGRRLLLATLSIADCHPGWAARLVTETGHAGCVP